MENEIWRPVAGWNYYEVSNYGRVKSLDRYVRHYGGMALKKGKILTPKLNLMNHCQVIFKEGERIWHPLVHLLVWEAFMGPIPEGMQINHLDENPLNNRLDNLSLVTPKENTNYGTCIERRSKKCSETMKGKRCYSNNQNAKPILQYTKNGKLIKEWDCIKTAAEYYGICYQTIWRHLKGKTKQCHNSIWKYKRDVA